MKKYEPLSVKMIDINIQDDILTSSAEPPMDDIYNDPFN